MSFLEELLIATRARVEAARAALPDDQVASLARNAPTPRDFAAALRGSSVGIIAEIKRATPSKGTLAADLDAGALARLYAEGGAAAISVLTEPDRFLGSFEDLRAAVEAGLPVLCKDFIIDPFQVAEARGHGADAVLLIVRAVGEDLPELLSVVRATGMEALVEVFDETEVEVALAAGASIIGVNHRDLETFVVDPDRTAKLAPLVPEQVTLVALSGVSTRVEIESLAAAGAHAVLVGESLVTSPDPVATLKELLGR